LVRGAASQAPEALALGLARIREWCAACVLLYAASAPPTSTSQGCTKKEKQKGDPKITREQRMLVGLIFGPPLNQSS
jgi:hypothetical protein